MNLKGNAMTVFSQKNAQGKVAHCLLAAMAITVVSTGLALADHTAEHSKSMADHKMADHKMTDHKMTDHKMTEMPQPTAEHQWLQQFVGNWQSQTEATYEPGKPAETSTGTETVKALGGFWITNEVKGTMMAKPFTGVMSLGYDNDKKKYVSTWMDSMTGKLWEYEGKVDPTGKVLTLETEGECPMNPGKMMKFKETLEIKDKNHKVFTSYMQGDDGNWMKTMTSTATRK